MLLIEKPFLKHHGRLRGDESFAQRINTAVSVKKLIGVPVEAARLVAAVMSDVLAGSKLGKQLIVFGVLRRLRIRRKIGRCLRWFEVLRHSLVRKREVDRRFPKEMTINSSKAVDRRRIPTKCRGDWTIRCLTKVRGTRSRLCSWGCVLRSSVSISAPLRRRLPVISRRALDQFRRTSRKTEKHCLRRSALPLPGRSSEELAMKGSIS